jgi:fatty-acyl-CoA synthase
VAQVGVIGTPDEKWGEAVTAIVVLRPGAELTDAVEAEIKQMVKDRKGAVMSPKQVVATDALPLTGLGKPDKKALRAQYWTGERSVG